MRAAVGKLINRMRGGVQAAAVAPADPLPAEPLPLGEPPAARPGQPRRRRRPLRLSVTRLVALLAIALVAGWAVGQQWPLVSLPARAEPPRDTSLYVLADGTLQTVGTADLLSIRPPSGRLIAMAGGPAVYALAIEGPGRYRLLRLDPGGRLTEIWARRLPFHPHRLLVDGEGTAYLGRSDGTGVRVDKRNRLRPWGGLED